MKPSLIIVEGLPCSGKSTVSQYISQILSRTEKVCFVDEGTGNHPADYEFHALAPAGMMSKESRIVPLSGLSDDLLERLLPYKIYDGLPWHIERPVMLARWQEFARESNLDTVYVFNCVLLQNPMCETMMRFGFDEKTSQNYIEEIVSIIRPMNPMVIYLKNDNIADAVCCAAPQRPGWLEAVIDYHINGAYGKSIGAKGFDGYIACLKERQRRELEILKKLSAASLVLDNPQRDWQKTRENLRAYFAKDRSEE